MEVEKYEVIVNGEGYTVITKYGVKKAILIGISKWLKNKQVAYLARRDIKPTVLNISVVVSSTNRTDEVPYEIFNNFVKEIENMTNLFNKKLKGGLSE